MQPTSVLMDGARLYFESQGHPECILLTPTGQRGIADPFNFGDQSYRSSPMVSGRRVIAFSAQWTDGSRSIRSSARPHDQATHQRGIERDPSWAPIPAISFFVHAGRREEIGCLIPNLVELVS